MNRALIAVVLLTLAGCVGCLVLRGSNEGGRPWVFVGLMFGGSKDAPRIEDPARGSGVGGTSAPESAGIVAPSGGCGGGHCSRPGK